MLLGLTISASQFCLWGCPMKDIRLSNEQLPVQPNILKQKPGVVLPLISPNQFSPQQPGYSDQYQQKKN